MENLEKKDIEPATDMEVVLFLAQHIENPCEDSNGNNLRDDYLRYARNTLKNMKDQNARNTLQRVIEIYSKK